MWLKSVTIRIMKSDGCSKLLIHERVSFKIKFMMLTPERLDGISLANILASEYSAAVTWFKQILYFPMRRSEVKRFPINGEMLRHSPSIRWIEG
jgi:Fe-S cluster assembly ATPase SufC